MSDLKIALSRLSTCVEKKKKLVSACSQLTALYISVFPTFQLISFKRPEKKPKLKPARLGVKYAGRQVNIFTYARSHTNSYALFDVLSCLCNSDYTPH